MKKRLIIGILILSLLCIGLLSGCYIRVPYSSFFIFNLCNWSSSNSAFNNCINDLKTPKEICQYMKDNFHYKYVIRGKSPYGMWLNTWGDCRDHSCFGRYAAQQHGYTAYDMYMTLIKSGYNASHIVGIYIEGSSYSYSSDSTYHSGYNSFQQIARAAALEVGATLVGWVVYDDCRYVINSYNITTSTKFVNPGSSQYGTLIGEEAINRSGHFGEGYTIINKGVPAQASGTVKLVAIWASYSMSNVEVATFYEVSPGRYSTRDTQSIGGTIFAGSRREYNVNLDVQVGDLIGIYFTSGHIEKDVSGYSGTWSTRGDYIPCTNKSFSSYSGYCISLEGVVVSP